MILDVRAFEGGYCRHLLASIDGRSFRVVSFQAVFLALRHERLGWILVDTAYGSRFFEATRAWPYRLYRLVTPVHPLAPTADILHRGGIDPEAIRHLVITHFHADHIGGLREFPKATLYYQREALDSLRGLSPFRQLRAAFLPDLLPPDIELRSVAVPRATFRPRLGFPFACHDLFGDGSLTLVDLPGHAPGQVGLEFRSTQGLELYAADAYWLGAQVKQNLDPTFLAMQVQWDRKAYRQTVAGLRQLRRAGTHRITACHDEGTASCLNTVDAQTEGAGQGSGVSSS